MKRSRRSLLVAVVSTMIVGLLASTALAAPPGNDNFAAATVITGTRVTKTGDSTNGASTEPGEPSHAGVTNGGSIWYAWTPAANGPVTIHTGGSNFDTVLAVYTGSVVSSLTGIAANDDEPGTDLLTSRVHFDAVAGTTYSIAVAGYGGDTGSVRLRLYQGPVSTTRVSLSSTGGQIGSDSYGYGADGNGNPGGGSMIDADGSVIVFANASNGVVAGDAGGLDDIFARDIAFGTTVRASIDTGGGNPNGISYDPVVSGDGNLVVFTSEATDLVAGDTGGQADIFLRNLSGAATTRINADTGGASANDWSQNPAISSDGNVVAFESWATDLTAPAGNGNLNIFVRSISGASTTEVSVQSAPSTTQGNGDSFDPSVSSDGAKVAYESDANNLLGAGVDTNGSTDIFLRDRTTPGAETTERVSVDSNEAQVNGDSTNPSISADGSKVAFQSDASNLIASDTNGTTDIFVRDRILGTTERVSVRSNGIQQIQGKGNSFDPVISADGRYVVFTSDASNLVTGDTNGTPDIFLHDLLTGVTSRVSVQTGGDQANGASGFPAVSGDGDIVWTYDDGDLVTGDSNARDDLFLRTIGFQGDALIRGPADATYSGDDLYQAVASGVQAKTAKAAKGSTQTFGLQIQNDGSVSDAFTVLGCAKSAGFTVTYVAGGANVTAAVTAGTYTTGAIAPDDASSLDLIVKLSKKAKGTKTCEVVVTSASDGTKTDHVKATVKALKK